MSRQGMLSQTQVDYLTAGKTITLVKLWDPSKTCSSSQCCHVNQLDISINDYKVLLKEYRGKKAAMGAINRDGVKQALAESLL
jgi:hypothetical protein